MNPMHLMVVAGEVSSDNHGAKLISELKKKGNIKITAVGGKKMEEVADFLQENLVDKAVVGVWEVLKFIPFFIKLKNLLVKKYFIPQTIDGLVLIDYPGFNIALAKSAQKYNVPVFYYITPQVWAWGSSRIKLLSRICRKLYCVFHFEKELFEKAGAKVEFVGHPLLEDIPNDIDINDFNKKLNLLEKERVIALFPGSRKNEVLKHMPVMAEALKVNKVNYRLIIGKSSAVERSHYEKYLNDILITEDIYSLLKRSDIAVMSSGTLTLEAAVIGTPFITVYKVSVLSYLIARILVKVPFIAMVNILAGKEISPELIQNKFTPENLSKKLAEIIKFKQLRDKMKNDLGSVACNLGGVGASEKTAGSILKELR